MRIYFSTFVLVSLVSLGALARSGSTPGPPPTADDAARLEQQFEELAKKVGESGTIRVLVSFAMTPEWVPEGKMDRAQAEAQLGRVRERQRAIVAGLGLNQHSPGVRFFDMPSMALSINAQQLSLLRKMPEIRYIREPRQMRLM
jgi:hypothetical protein